VVAVRHAVVVLFVGACSGGATTGPVQPAVPVPSLTSGTALERFFPLVDGHIYQYTTEAADGGHGLLTARVRRADARLGTLSMSGSTRSFEYAADGVVLAGDGTRSYVLKEPLAAGNSWQGEHGGKVEIAAVDAAIEVPAGRYAGCVKTVEQRGGDIPLRVDTTFCPDVGIVLIEATNGADLERASLLSYGPEVDLGPEGVRRIP
jgi:hypothetical protein